MLISETQETNKSVSDKIKGKIHADPVSQYQMHYP